LPVFAATLVLGDDAVPWLGLRLLRPALLLEELLLLPMPSRAALLLRLLATRLLRSLHVRLRRLRRRVLLNLALLGLLAAWLVRLVFAATPAAPMSLRLSLPIGRDRPRVWLGRCRFCCHACTSWHSAVFCLTSLGQQLRIWGAELP